MEDTIAPNSLSLDGTALFVEGPSLVGVTGFRVPLQFCNWFLGNSGHEAHRPSQPLVLPPAPSAEETSSFWLCSTLVSSGWRLQKGTGFQGSSQSSAFDFTPPQVTQTDIYHQPHAPLPFPFYIPIKNASSSFLLTLRAQHPLGPGSDPISTYSIQFCVLFYSILCTNLFIYMIGRVERVL